MPLSDRRPSFKLSDQPHFSASNTSPSFSLLRLQFSPLYMPAAGAALIPQTDPGSIRTNQGHNRLLSTSIWLGALALNHPDINGV